MMIEAKYSLPTNIQAGFQARTGNRCDDYGDGFENNVGFVDGHVQWVPIDEYHKVNITEGQKPF